MTDISKHPLLKACHEACCAIEKLSASPEQTDAVSRVFDMMRPIEALVDERDTLAAECAAKDARIASLLQDRLDYSNVTCKEGMNSSEWIWRTGKAEREAAASQARCAALEKALKQLLRRGHAHAPGCPICDEAKTALSTPSPTGALYAVVEKAIRKGVAALDEFADADNDDPKTDWISGHNLNYHPEVIISIMLHAAGLGDKEKP